MVGMGRLNMSTEYIQSLPDPLARTYPVHRDLNATTAVDLYTVLVRLYPQTTVTVESNWALTSDQTLIHFIRSPTLNSTLYSGSLPTPLTPMPLPLQTDSDKFVATIQPPLIPL
jgi:hypothetical protein